MYFTSFELLINMDGHGFYVWLCYGSFSLLVAGNILIARRCQQRLIKQIKSQLRR